MPPNWPWQRCIDRRAAAAGPHAALFEPYRGREWIALDLETTGLDPARDAILAIAAIPCVGNRIQLSRALDVLVQSDSRHIPDAIRHHRLRPTDVAGGIPLDDALQRLLALIGNRPLVGYCIGFDIAMIDRALRPRLGFGLPNRRIDVQREYAEFVRRSAPLAAPPLSFDAIAAALSIDTGERHRARDDAIAAALMHLRLSR
jgi:DNA polymerase III subunit epsilon